MAQRVNRHPEAFSLDRAGMQKRKRVHAEGHLAWIRTLPCLVTGSTYEVEAAHVRYADPRFAKPAVGIGIKPSDSWVVPLCAVEHRTGKGAQHSMNERQYWRGKGIDPVLVAAALWMNSGDDEAAALILRTARAGGTPI